MSQSNDNLPVVEDAPILPPLLDKRTKETVTDLRWLLALGFGSIAAVVVATVSTVSFAQDAGVKAVAPVELRVTALEKNQADMQRMTLETNATVKMIAYRLGVTPLSLEQPRDGGL